MELISEASDTGAGLLSASREIGICHRTLKRGRKDFGAYEEGVDRR